MISIISDKEAYELSKKVNLPAGPLSYTQISTFLSCGMKYRFKYVDKVKTDYFSTNLFYGSVMHIGLEHFLKENNLLLKERMRISDKAMKLGAKEYLQRANYSPNQQEIQEFQKSIRALMEMKNLWVETNLSYLNPTGIEKSIWMELDGVPYIVKIDMINDNCVSDFKLTSRAKSQNDADNSLQLSMYSIGTGLSDVSFISFKKPNFSTKKRWKAELPKVITSFRTENDKKWSREVLNNVYASITSKVYTICDPENYTCTPDYCEYWDMCRGKTQDKKIQKPSWMSGIKLSV